MGPLSFLSIFLPLAMYCAPLIADNKINVDAWACLTPQQKAKLLDHCTTEDRPVFAILRGASFMVKQLDFDSDEASIEGILPWCGLYGCILSDGSTHT